MSLCVTCGKAKRAILSKECKACMDISFKDSQIRKVDLPESDKVNTNNVWARELFFETVSRINFIAEHTLKGEYTEKFSMAEFNLNDANAEVLRLVKSLHASGHKLKLYLNKTNVRLFEQYLIDSQEGYDAAKEAWGQWDQDDTIAIEQHTVDMLSWQQEIAAKTIKAIKLSS